MEKAILDHYFIELRKALAYRNSEYSSIIQELEENWRYLYPVAWADFHRFLKGWSAEYWKINCYSEKTTRQVIEDLSPKEY